MRHIPRIYIPDIALEAGTSLTLDDIIRHRLANVHRVKEEQPVILFNGLQASEANATIRQITRKQIVLDVLSVEKTQRESPLQTRLCQSLEKTDRMDYAMQKSVELGVNAVQPMLTTYSLAAFKGQRLAKKMAHWQGVIIHACEQSGRCILPTLHEPVHFSELLQQRNHLACGIIPDPDAKEFLNDQHLNTCEMIDILIGPIGGYTAEEVQMASNNGLLSVRLGPRILRTETAGPALLAILQSRFGDWNLDPKQA